jgi:RNA polymerase sigma-70 factor (ECF subfamily)
MENFDSVECLARVQAGDEDAARALFHHLYPLAARLVRAHLPPRTSEEDLCQTALVKVFTHLDQYHGRMPIEHWVSRIVINTCLNQLRAEKVRPELRMSDLSAEQAELVEALAGAAAELPADQSAYARELVEILLARLSPEDRLLINLVHLQERSMEEVAQLTGWNRALIKVKAFRARARMRRHLAELPAGESPL